MKISVRTNPLKLKGDFAGLVKWMAEHGFGAIDLPKPDKEMKALCDKAGLAIGSFDAPASGKLLTADEAARAQALAALKKELSLAGELGLKTLFVCLGPVDKAAPRAKTFEIWKAVFPEVVAQCESLGINIAMEPWPGPGPTYPTIGCTPEMWRAMFEAIPSKNLGLCYDPSHMLRLGIDYIRVLREFGERVHHVHAKDCAIMQEDLYLHGRLPRTFGKPPFANSEGWWRYCIPGDGEVDWRKVVVQLVGLGYTGSFGIELEDGVYGADEEANKRGLLAAKAHLDSVIR